MAWLKWTNPSGNCVEVALAPDGRVMVRNSKDPDGPVVYFSKDEWESFLGGVVLGKFGYSTLPVATDA